jgi:hypothetical protein
MNLKKLRRIYREERLQVRRRSGRKRALGARVPKAIPQVPISVGASTSLPMRSPMDVAFVFSSWLTISRANVWHLSRTLPWAALVSFAILMPSLLCVDGRRRVYPTTGPS